ncbi:MAG: GMP synthase [Zetaproteobacteria bacterium CG12_big_fil_rev_8_21_14_0_65_54_13]|nr:MAG: GMP synthase [Zetaproteobacteria bacterium CG12_big_fil_rev_8_21_14_0_65_54_13]PIX53458.1 MAG: GMP synthase [Zetaproteobacteria bacterium CG_4_10_14_3_um_filter_54_28]PJA27697.1 MAG: GMP synthase [Zetaproteobacteria bacterium CG_4_9_14_3_um_filter_54_145]
MNFLVIQHLDIEPPALIGDLLSDAGHQLQIVHIDVGDTLPEYTTDLHGVIIMGGPQSANDTHLSYIRDELLWLEERIAAGVPMLGICLGAQLMAKAAGAVITPSPVRELGWYPLYPTTAAVADPLFSALPASGLPMFQWHGDTFSLPAHASLLASCADVPAQAFRLGLAQYGLQFHVEVDAEMIEAWIMAGESERHHLGSTGIDLLRAQTSLHLAAMQHYGRKMITNWLHGIQKNLH